MKACAIFFNKPLSYGDGLAMQNAILEARISGLIPDTVIFLQHLPVITCGVRSKPEQILLSAEELAARKIEISKSSRGGAATYHGPGQLVMYPVIKIGRNRSPDGAARGYLHDLEEVAIRTAGDYGVAAVRRRGLTGAWTRWGKLAAIGVRFKRWISFHGMSFNVDPDLSGFDAIVPCGLTGEKVASLKLILGADCPTLDRVRGSMAAHFSSVFGMTLAPWRRFSSAPADAAAIAAILARGDQGTNVTGPTPA